MTDETGWRPITEEPDRPMTVLYYSALCRWHDQNGVEHTFDGDRDEKFGLGFWDGEWLWLGTAHGVFEFEYEPGHPDCPTHWMPAPLPPPPTPKEKA